MDETLLILIAKHTSLLGTPNAGSTSDVWSMPSCRESFACLRASLVMDGDMVAGLTGCKELEGKLIDLSPILAFTKFEEAHHTGEALARWKKSALAVFQMDKSIGLATEDGASNNKKANRILGQDQAVCADHDIARAILFVSGDTGTPSQNPALKEFSRKGAKQSASFSRSVVINKALEDAQLEANPDLKPHQTKKPALKNVTRWTGLHTMSQKNRELKEAICMALTGDKLGDCDEEPALVVNRGGELQSDSSDDEDEANSEGEEQERANRTANKSHPLAHRCMTATEFRHNDLFESVLDRAKEVTVLIQDCKEGWGEGLDIGVSFMAISEMRDEALAARLEVVSGHGENENWKEISGGSLPHMFQLYRSIFAAQLTKRFKLDTTPSSHVQLALQMNPAIDISADGPLLIGKSAFLELMGAEYRRALKRQALKQAGRVGPTPGAPAPADAPAPAPAPAAAAAAAAPAAPAAPAAAAAAATAAAADTPQPQQKRRRRSLLGAVALKQTGGVVQAEGDSLLDLKVSAEIEKFEHIRCKTLAKV